MAPAMMLMSETREDGVIETLQYQKGVKHLCEKGISRVPTKYILPAPERPHRTKGEPHSPESTNLKLPIIDFSELQGPNRFHVLETLAYACEHYGFFQVIHIVNGYDQNIRKPHFVCVLPD